MFERETEYFRSLTFRQKAVIGAAALLLVGVPLEVTVDQSNRPADPQVRFYDPLSLIAAPTSNWIESQVDLTDRISTQPNK